MSWATGPFAQGEVCAECQMIAVHNYTVPYQIPCNSSRMYLNVGDEKFGAEDQVSRNFVSGFIKSCCFVSSSGLGRDRGHSGRAWPFFSYTIRKFALPQGPQWLDSHYRSVKIVIALSDRMMTAVSWRVGFSTAKLLWSFQPRHRRVCRHLEYDQYLELHLFVIAQRAKQ
jgi:hypothetical protein